MYIQSKEEERRKSYSMTIGRGMVPLIGYLSTAVIEQFSYYSMHWVFYATIIIIM